MDEIDLHILAILQEKARIPNVDVAREVGMAPSAVLERIRKLEKHEIIDGYEVRLNPKRFRRSLVAFITVIPEKNADDSTLGAQLAQLPEVQEVHQISGEDGFLIKVRTADTQDLGKLLRQRIRALAGVQTTKTSIALSTIKETARIPIDIID
jgi:Lrp/AsnC family leucine-responsive transcriptional regulator